MGYCKFCKRELSPSDKPDAHKSCLDLIDQLKAGKPLDLAPEISLWPKDTVEEEVAD